MKALRTLPAILLPLLPQAAYAQHVPVVFAVAALSPLFVLVLTIILGFTSRSWRVGALHSGLVVFWVLLFLVASRYVENDYVIRTPIVLYVVHALLVVILIVVSIARRRSPET
jgi:hypothetical protein